MEIIEASINSLGNLSAGDHITVPGGKFSKGKFNLYDHHMLVVEVKNSSEVVVIHSSEGQDIVEETLPDLDPCEVKVLYYFSSFSAYEAIERARSRFGSWTYNLLSRNCEHFVMWAKTGNGISFQVKRALKTGIGTGAGAGTGAAAGTAAGAVAGAALGSFAPIVGTITGGVLGAIIGGVGATVVGGAVGGVVGNVTGKKRTM